MGWGRMRRKKGDNVKIRNAKPNEYDGVKFRSKLETYIYKKLKENGIDAEYEKHKFILLKSFEFQGEKIREWTYRPDFVNLKDRFIIEGKGWQNDLWPNKLKMFKNYLNSTNMEDYALFVVSNQREVNEMIDIIKNKKLNKENESS